MTKQLLYIVFFMPTFSLMDAMTLSEKNLEKVETELIAAYLPTEENCGAGSKNLQSEQGTLACMLAGKKNVFWGSAMWYQKLSAEFKELMQKKEIKILTLTNKNEMIWYTPAGSKNALLLAKHLNDLVTDQNKIPAILKEHNELLAQANALAASLESNQVPVNNLPKTKVAQDFFSAQSELARKLNDYQHELRIHIRYLQNRLSNAIQGHNPYLVGTLLGYTEAQIKTYFTDANLYETKKQEAEKWLKEQASQK